MAYAARQYRLRPGAARGPVNGGPGFMALHRGFLVMVFEHDAGTFTVLFVRPSDDKTLALLRHTGRLRGSLPGGARRGRVDRPGRAASPSTSSGPEPA